MSTSKILDGERQLPLDFESPARVENKSNETKKIVVAVQNASVHCLSEVRLKRQDNQDKTALEKILSHAKKLNW
jgi:hypothetical protein